ncbi:hypothetical protein LguiA_004770 [Lonicera macranthoides]
MEDSGESPTTVTHGTFIRGFCKAGRVELALDHLCRLRSKSQPVDSYCYNIVIHGFCQKAELDEALRALEEMKSRGVNPDVYSYSILINGFCIRGDLDKGDTDSAGKLIEEMINSNLKTSVSNYKSLLQGCCKAGSLDKALEYFNSMLEVGVFPDIFTCNSIVTEYCSKGCVKEALQLIRIREFHPQPPQPPRPKIR